MSHDSENIELSKFYEVSKVTHNRGECIRIDFHDIHGVPYRRYIEVTTNSLGVYAIKDERSVYFEEFVGFLTKTPVYNVIFTHEYYGMDCVIYRQIADILHQQNPDKDKFAFEDFEIVEVLDRLVEEVVSKHL